MAIFVDKKDNYTYCELNSNETGFPAKFIISISKQSERIVKSSWYESMSFVVLTNNSPFRRQNSQLLSPDLFLPPQLMKEPNPLPSSGTSIPRKMFLFVPGYHVFHFITFHGPQLIQP